MPTLLHLDSSAHPDSSVTKTLTARFAEAWAAAGPGRTVVHRDLHADPLPHLENAELHFPASQRLSAVAEEADARQNEVVAQLLSADAIVVGAPMYNYSMPSTLKAWIDRIHLPGVLTGVPELPLAGRPAVIVSASGAAYDPGTPSESWDHVVPPLQIVLGTALGMDVHVVTARLTLAGRAPDLAPLIPRAERELLAAEQEIDRLALAL